MGLKEAYLPLLIFITILIFILKRGKFSIDFFLIFLSYLILNLVIEFVSGIAYYHAKSNLVIYDIDILIEGLTFCYTFYYLHFSSKVKNLLIVAALILVLFWITDFSFIQMRAVFNTYSYLLSCLILSTFSLLSIYLFVFESIYDDPFRNFFFWLSIGILFCYLGNIPYLMFFNILVMKSRITAFSLGIISQIVNSILYIMIITGTLRHQPSGKFSVDRN